MIIERHTSPDGLLKLIVDQSQDGETTDYTIGLEDYASHTHGDILAKLTNLTELEAIRQYVDEILSDQQMFMVIRSGGNIQDIWIIDGDIESHIKYKDPDEDLEFRYWSGKQVI